MSDREYPDSEPEGLDVWEPEEDDPNAPEGEPRRPISDQLARRERLRQVLETWPPEPGTNEVPDLVSDANATIGRYVTVTEDDRQEKWLAVYETLDEALEGAAEEVLGEYTWWPVAIYDLDTGQSLPYGIKVNVFVSDDEGARVYGDLEPLPPR